MAINPYEPPRCDSTAAPRPILVGRLIANSIATLLAVGCVAVFAVGTKGLIPPWAVESLAARCAIGGGLVVIPLLLVWFPQMPRWVTGHDWVTNYACGWFLLIVIWAGIFAIVFRV